MHPLDRIAERKIQEAIAKGELDNLPGAGKPLELDSNPLVPEHLRAGLRLLKNAGCLPPELEAMKDVRAAAELLGRVRDPEQRETACKRLRLLELRMHEQLARMRRL